MKALIIDPSRSFQLFLGMFLRKRGLITDYATNENEAEALLNKDEYQLICVARILTSGDCRSFCFHLRSQPESSMIPIIVFTASGDLDTESYLALGVTEVFHRQDVVALDAYIVRLKTTSSSNSKRGGKILYIEDSLSVAKLLIKSLEQQGYEVSHFTNGEEALSFYENNSFNLVLTDVVLAGIMDGTALVRHIRDMDKNKNSLPVSILAISSYEDNARTLSLFQAGVNDYVRKPVIDQELLARVDNLVLNHRLLKELEEQQQHLERIAMTDQLTGLYNRHYLMDVAQKKIASIKRHSVKLSLIVIDIDFFKKINDAHGHTMGDLILTQVGGLFKELTRDEDVVARIGGEEFVILLDACSLKHAFTKAEEIRKALEEANFENLNVTASFGVAQYGEDDKDFGALFMRADKATYLAKDNGRNTVATD